MEMHVLALHCAASRLEMQQTMWSASDTLFPFFTLFLNAVCLQKHVICMEKGWIYLEGMISTCLWSTTASLSCVSSLCALI